MNAKLSSALLATTLMAAVALSGPSHAQTARGTSKGAPSQVVRYSDLDLSTPGGIHTLYRRIQTAASQVCRQMVPPRNGPSGIENAKCRRTLVDAAVEQVHKPALTALHTGKRAGALTANR